MKIKKKTPYASYFEISAIINFVLIGLSFFIPFPMLITPTFPIEIMIYNIYLIAISIISNMIFLLTLGGMILLFGLKNKDTFGPYLQYSGIMFILAFIVSMIIIQPVGYPLGLLPQILYLIGFFESFEYMILTTLLVPLSIFRLFGVIYLIVHGYKNNEKFFIFAGISYFIAITFTAYGQIPFLLIHLGP